MRRTAWRRRTEGPSLPIGEERPMAPVRLAVMPNYGGGLTGPRPKTAPYRDRALLDLARGRPCLLLVPACCSHRMDTVVAAHSNLSIHGKSGARKADDCYTVAACHSCHSWLDQGKATFLHKEAAFMAAHLRQVLAWRQIAADPSEPERFRKAAKSALEQLNATQGATA